MVEALIEEDDAGASERPWPLPNEELVTGGPKWQFNACIGWQIGDWNGYTDGYRRAADVLLEHVARTCRDQDLLIWPFVQCWRHHIELLLKVLCAALQDLSDVQGEMPRTHSLDVLWKRVRPLLEKSSASESADIDNFENVLDQLHKLDRTSEVFRYPVTSSGAVHTFNDASRINMESFHGVMERAAAYLDVVYSKVSVELERRQEFEAEMRSCYGE